MKKGDKVSIIPRGWHCEHIKCLYGRVFEIEKSVYSGGFNDNKYMYELKGFGGLSVDFLVNESDLKLETLAMKRDAIKESNKLLEDLENFEKIIRLYKPDSLIGRFEYVEHSNERVIIDRKYTDQLLEVIKTLKSNLETKLESL